MIYSCARSCLLFFAMLAVATIFVGLIGDESAYAADVKAMVSDISAQHETAQDEKIRRLISTLESETARQELVSNLKLLLEMEESSESEAETAIPVLTESLGLRDLVSHLVVKYQHFLERNNLSNSILGRMVLTVLATMVSVFLIWGVKRLLTKALVRLKNNFQLVDITASHLRIYAKFLRLLISLGGGLMYIYSVSTIWSLPFERVFENQTFANSLATFTNVIIVLTIACLIWESINMGIAVLLKKADAQNQSRIKTILPIIKTILFIMFAVMFVLVLLSEIGINVGPLLAGAGIVGVALGFGAQTAVKDYISGFTIILEDLVRVGDVILVAGATGVVEKITLRKLQIRDFSGVVITVPYSEITVIQNMTKDFSYYLLNVNVSYGADINHAIATLRQVDQDMRSDYEFRSLMLEAIEIVGVDGFGDNAIVIKARLKTLPGQQWKVGREYNKRMKYAFDQAGIEIPFPQRTVTIRNETSKELTDAAIQAVGGA